MADPPNSQGDTTPLPRVGNVLAINLEKPAFVIKKASDRYSLHLIRISPVPRLAMKILRLSVLALLPVASYGAKKGGGTFEQFHDKFLSSAPLRLDDPSYETLTTAPRDYGVAVLLTALEARFGCALCRDFQPEWEVLAKSWAKGDKKGEARMLYGTLDFTDGKATFQKVWLSVSALKLTGSTKN